MATTSKKKKYPYNRYRKAYRDRHRALGLCVYCSKRASVGFVACLRHRKLTWEKLVLCGWCGKNVSAPRPQGKRYHAKCRRIATRYRSRLAWKLTKRKKRYVEAHRRAAIQYRLRHQRLHLCLNCPLPVAEGCRNFCRRHQNQRNKYSKRWKDKVWKHSKPNVRSATR